MDAAGEGALAAHRHNHAHTAHAQREWEGLAEATLEQRTVNATLEAISQEARVGVQHLSRRLAEFVHSTHRTDAHRTDAHDTHRTGAHAAVDAAGSSQDQDGQEHHAGIATAAGISAAFDGTPLLHYS